MNINVISKNITIEKKEIIKTGNLESYEINVTASEEYDKCACFVVIKYDDEIFKIPVEDGKIKLPILLSVPKDKKIYIGFYGAYFEDDEVKEINSANFDYLNVVEGSFKEDIPYQEEIYIEMRDKYLQAMKEFYEASNKKFEDAVDEAKVDIEDAKNNAVEEINDLNKGLKTDVAAIKQEQNTQNANINENAAAITRVLQSLLNYALKSELPTDLSQLSNAITNYINATQLNNAVSSEATTREQADISLQGQIDAISSASDVVDVVASYADLQNYETTSLTDRDVIKVMQDSTHSNALSYYRWTIENDEGSWVFVGSEGPFHTKGEMLEMLADYVKNTDYATAQKGGTIKGNMNGLMVNVGTGVVSANDYAYSAYESAANSIFVGKGTLEKVITGKELVNKTYVDTIVGDINTLLDELNGEVI